MLEDHIAKLSAEVTSRDALDAEIQTCVAGLFERTRALEFENDVLRAELVRLGVSPDALFRQHSLSALGPLDSGSLQDSTRQGSGRGMHAGGGVIHKADVLIVE